MFCRSIFKYLQSLLLARIILNRSTFPPLCFHRLVHTHSRKLFPLTYFRKTLGGGIPRMFVSFSLFNSLSPLFLLHTKNGGGWADTLGRPPEGVRYSGFADSGLRGMRKVTEAGGRRALQRWRMARGAASFIWWTKAWASAKGRVMRKRSALRW